MNICTRDIIAKIPLFCKIEALTFEVNEITYMTSTLISSPTREVIRVSHNIEIFNSSKIKH